MLDWMRRAAEGAGADVVASLHSAALEESALLHAAQGALEGRCGVAIVSVLSAEELERAAAVVGRRGAGEELGKGGLARRRGLRQCPIHNPRGAPAGGRDGCLASSVSNWRNEPSW